MTSRSCPFLSINPREAMSNTTVRQFICKLLSLVPEPGGRAGRDDGGKTGGYSVGDRIEVTGRRGNS